MVSLIGVLSDMAYADIMKSKTICDSIVVNVTQS